MQSSVKMAAKPRSVFSYVHIGVPRVYQWSEQRTSLIADDSQDIGPWLAVAESHVEDGSYHQPLRLSSLYRKLADLENAEGVLAFANRYGLLGKGVREGKEPTGIVPSTETDAMGVTGPLVGESLSWWLLESEKMHVLMEAAEIHQKGDVRAAYRLTHDVATGQVLDPRELLRKKRKWGWNWRMAPIALAPDERPLHAVERFLQTAIEQELGGHLRVMYDLKGKQFRFVPDCFLTALYLTLAIDTLNWLGDGQVVCGVCGKTFNAQRATRRYCSQKCCKAAQRLGYTNGGAK